MKTPIFFLLLLNSFCSIGLFVRDSYAVTQDLRAEFVEMAPKGWKRMEQSYRALKGVLDVKFRVGTQQLQDHSIKFVTGGDSQKIELSLRSDRKNADLILCRNHLKKYWFSVTEKSGSPKYTLDNLGEFSDAKSLYQISPDRAKAIRSLFQYLHSPWSYELYSFPLLLKDEGFKISKVSSDEKDNDLVSVEFEFETKEPEKLSSLKNGMAVFSKKSLWGLVRLTAETSWGGINVSIEYQSGPSGLVFPKTIIEEKWSGVPGKSELGSNYKCEISNIEAYKASPQEFTLSAFGFHDLEKKEKHTIRNAIILFLTGAALIGTCIYINQKWKTNRDGRQTGTVPDID